MRIDYVDDPRVAVIADGYRVRRDDGAAVKVLPLGRSDAWAVFFDHASIENPRPPGGFSGSASPDPAQAIAWALRP